LNEEVADFHQRNEACPNIGYEVEEELGGELGNHNNARVSRIHNNNKCHPQGQHLSSTPQNNFWSKV
jgi:hypothetical protein